jgi:hypothetical protein
MSTVDTAPTETAALVRRMVRQTMTVVGGSIAVTALAWAISSGSASAETICEAPPLPPVPAISELADASQQDLQPVPDLVCAVQQTVPVSPVGQPASGSAGHPGGAADSPVFAAPPLTSAQLDLAAGHTLPAGDLVVADQPDVTPD